MAPPIPQDDCLEDFTRRQITLDSITKTVYMASTRSEVIIMAEMPSISPHVTRFARWIRDAGLTVYMPSLFGRNGAVPEADAGAKVFRRACVNTEFRASVASQSSPITQRLRYLARLAHMEYGSPGVSVIGICFTGNFALTIMLEPAMLTPVLCQPSLPLNASGRIEIAPEDVAAVRQRLEQEDSTVLTYRFEGNRFCRVGRFAAYAYTLGGRSASRVLSNSAAHSNPPPFFARHVPCPHGVAIARLIDTTGEPTLTARNEILAFSQQRLD